MSKLRDALLNTEPGREIVVVETVKGPLKYEVRERTVGQQQDLLDKCRYKSGPREGELNMNLFQVEALIATVHDPETGDRVFEDADREALKHMASGPFNLLLKASNRAAGLDTDSAAVADLGEPPADEPSSS